MLRILVIAAIISINIGCDQSTKYLAKKHLPRAGTIQVIDNIFILHYAENRGGFLSIFSTLPGTLRLILLSIIPLISLVLMTCYLVAGRELSSLYILALSCIIGGGLSNIGDRLMNEHVIDFMNIGIGAVRSGIFNFADLSIMAGAAMIVWTVIKEKKSPAGSGFPS
jgi:signal peptidase II